MPTEGSGARIHRRSEGLDKESVNVRSRQFADFKLTNQSVFCSVTAGLARGEMVRSPT